MLSHDHKPELEKEKIRILASGGRVDKYSGNYLFLDFFYIFINFFSIFYVFNYLRGRNKIWALSCLDEKSKLSRTCHE
jgi:hypothetical protein